MSGWTIERAAPVQAPALTEITRLAKRHWGYPERWLQIWAPLLEVRPQDIREQETWIARAGPVPVAYYSIREQDGQFWLHNLWVLPQWMGRGLGRALFLHALERSRARGAKTLMIESDPNARGFYERMGAVQTGEHHGEVDGHPRILPVLTMALAE